MSNICQKSKAVDKTTILKIITSSPILEAVRETGCDPAELAKLYNDLENLLKGCIPYAELGEKFRFLLVLTSSKGKLEAEMNIFETGEFVSAIKAGLLDKGNILVVSSEGKVIEQVDGEYISDYVQATRISRENQSIVFFIEYRAVHLIVNGKPIYYVPDIIQSQRTGVTVPKSLPAREYRQLIKNQYDEMVHKERGVKYWANKASRILVDNPEIHFHKPLWWYLDQHIPDAKVDSGATVSGTDDRTDIRILAFNTAELYIVELKCLGTTKSGSALSDDWANQGLIQLNLYLEEEGDAKRGTLVLYDGRADNKEVDWCTGIKCSPKYDNDPIRFYLESESATVKAKKILRDLKKQSRSGKGS